ncbi:hypothetical protein [Streptomyces sp. NRRL B-3229]|uniref:hypothetical protein n=1 Tax=Streptomyces sp. NRRL B-3229 TaxID=1463836 RepID=UPI000D140727|nr:hypothetical protein [Streptomyces sp. NRRL B-3229]
MPGDLITTGTPNGTGPGHEREVPPRPTIQVISEIRGVGELRLSVIRSGSDTAL